MENNKELFESIFNVSPGGTDTRGYLEDIAGNHPYFAPAQFYLLQQTKKDNSAYGKQVQKTAALFNNNYWLNYLLTASSKPESIFVQSSFEPEETITDLKTTFAADNNIASVETEIETASIQPLEVIGKAENEIINYESIAEELATDDITSPGEPVVITKEAVENNYNNYSEIAEEELSPVTAEATVKDEAVPYEPMTIQEEVSGTEIEKSVTLETGQPVTEETANINVPAETTVALTTNSFSSEIIDGNTAVQLPEPAADEANEITPVAPESIITFPGNSSKESIKEVGNSDEALLFQPLHTSDYFASLGIKLSEEANNSDRLGKQLKSFTQWLKTMKKIDSRNTDPLLPAEIASENVDVNIQHLAEKSNKEDEVITEAMADVLVQQGRINKAVELLKKLSLLNPSKSTYFAAKIEQLKD